MVGPNAGDHRHGLLCALLLSGHAVRALRGLGRGLAVLADRRALGLERLAARHLPLEVRDPRDGGPPHPPGLRRAGPLPAGDPGAAAVSHEILGFVLLAVFLFAIFIGFPVSFTLIFLSLAFGYFALGDMVFYLTVLQTIGLMKEEVLAAVPLFIFMGYLLEEGGLMERLFHAFRLLMGGIPGSLYVAVLATATIFGIAAGTVGATVAVVGIMAVPTMVRAGYDVRLSAGSITAGGSLGILIPPSVMLVVMGPVMGVSVADLYAACFGPGFLLAGIFIGWTLIRSLINPRLGPPLPVEQRSGSLRTLTVELTLGMLPHVILTVITLGPILAGMATPTEAAAVGVVGTVIMAALYRALSWTRVKDAMLQTAQQTSMVLFLAVASNIFGAVFTRLGSATLMTDTLIGLPLPPLATMLVVMFLTFLIGWPF
ncbi:MAG: TRAP transporter large permease subunit, partial [Candidatus Rokuibacteriota bacterium]